MNEAPETYLRRVGIPFKKAGGKNGRELLVECPACGREGKCSINSRTFKFQCFVCEAKGGEVTFKRLRGDLLTIEDGSAKDAEKARDEAFERALAAKQSRTDVERWAEALQESPDAEHARRYLVDERRITLDTARALLIGWSATFPGSKPAQSATRRRRRRAGSTPKPVAVKLKTGPGWITIPSFAQHDADGKPKPASCAMVKLRSVPPAEKAYRRITGGESILYAPSGIDASSTLVLVGGEFDAVVLWQLGVTNVVAGTTGEKGWSDVWTRQIEDVEDIVVVYDSDGTGQQGAEALAKKLGSHRCRVGQWPNGHNDANDALVAMGDDFDLFAVQEIIANASSTMAAGIVRVSGIRDRYKRRLREKGHRGVTSGYPHLDDLLGGVRWGEVTVFTGDTSSGKTTFISDWSRRMASKVVSTDSTRGSRDAIPTLVCAFEMGPERQLDKWVRQVAAAPPDELDEPDLDKALDELDSLPLWLLKHYGAFTAEALRGTLVYAARVLGVKFVVLDHLHFMVREGADDERERIAEICMVVAEVALAEDLHVVLVAHPHNTGSSRDKDRDNRIIQLGDLKGSSAIKQIADNVFSMWKPRNASRDGVVDAQGYGESVLYLLKARSDYGLEGSVPFSFWIRGARYLDPDSNFTLLRGGETVSSGPAAAPQSDWISDYD